MAKIFQVILIRFGYDGLKVGLIQADPSLSRGRTPEDLDDPSVSTPVFDTLQSIAGDSASF
jgi:hypothetical protein